MGKCKLGMCNEYLLKVEMKIDLLLSIFIWFENFLLL